MLRPICPFRYPNLRLKDIVLSPAPPCPSSSRRSGRRKDKGSKYPCRMGNGMDSVPHTSGRNHSQRMMRCYFLPSSPPFGRRLFTETVSVGLLTFGSHLPVL